MMPASARSSCLRAGLFVVATFTLAAARAEPLPTSNQNPLLVASGIPLALPAREAADGWQFSADLNWASTALARAAGQELLVVDAESRELRFTVGRRLTDRWSMHVQLPFRELSGGSLDSFIDDWHDVFGLPEGARPMQPHDRLRVYYSRDGATVLEEGRSQSGLADANASISYQLLSSPNSAARAAISVDLPIGEEHWFLSSDAIELSALIAAEHRFNDRWSLYGQGAVTWLDEGQLLRGQQRSVVWSGHTALAWQATRALAFIAQLNAHTRVYDDSDLDFFKEAIILTVGGRIALKPNWSLNLGVSEDIAVEQSPDVVFVMGVSRTQTR